VTASPRLCLCLLAVGTLAVLTAGCATYSSRVADLRPQLAAGDYDAALATVEEGTGGKDVLLAFLERGLILHYAGRFQESNEAFAAAERTAEELYNRSLAEGAVSLITNDMQISYRARPFELAMVPYFRSLNYLELGLRDDALVEARKTSLLLSKYIDATIAGIEKGPTGKLERTKNDPFMLYYSGMLYDWDGELNDAFIAYRNAATAYQDVHDLVRVQIPPSLARDLERVSANLAFEAELEQLRRVCPDVFAAAAGSPPAVPAAGEGEVVLLLEVGYVPQRTEVEINLPIFEGEQDDDKVTWAWRLTDRAGNVAYVSSGRDVAYWLSLALPEMKLVPSAVRRARLHGPGGREAGSARAHNLASTARITFEAEYPMILFKTILRGLTKYLATAEAEKQDKFLGLVANLFNVATEAADTRSWLTLPEHVELMRLSLPEGVHDLRVELLDGRGRPVGEVLLPQVPVRAGDWTFVNHRVFAR
jgi:hypothetical protein